MSTIKNPSKCSSCGSSNIGIYNPERGTSFVLTVLDQTQSPPAFIADSGIPVHAFICADCGGVSLQIPQ